MQNMDYYDVLGVSKTATQDEIKTAYRNLIKAFHPDCYRGNKQFAQQKTIEINEAYEILKDNKKRYDYDYKNNFWKTSKSYDYSKDLNEAKKRAEEAEKARMEAEKKAEDERKKREDMANKAKAMYEQSSNKSGDKNYNESGIFKKIIFNCLAVVAGLIAYLIVDLVFCIIMGILSNVPIVGFVIKYIMYFPLESEFGLYSSRATFASLITCYVCQKIIDYARPKHNWSTCIVFMLLMPMLYNMYINEQINIWILFFHIGLYLFLMYTSWKN